MMKTAKLIAGNWKMNGLGGSLGEVEALRAALAEAAPACRIALCPPATLIERMARAAGQGIEIGGQDCRAESHGAFTGDVSAAMLRDAGATLVILGHSERRQGHGETDAVVAAKAEAALSAGLEPIICVGETLEQREAGRRSRWCGDRSWPPFRRSWLKRVRSPWPMSRSGRSGRA